ncbi:type II toxin-antitoxin system Phd/YefM family antitoxin [Candidatus Binatia bacterium]|nr:type II toxin-antitoxin system Phd/YefM family antitoxin [Candidatus Binatia bacterium]
MRVLPLAEAKARRSELVSDVETRDEEITITRNGRAVAVLVSHEDFERWRETAEIMADPEFLASIRKGMSEIKRGRARRFDDAALDRLFGTAG